MDRPAAGLVAGRGLDPSGPQVLAVHHVFGRKEEDAALLSGSCS